MQSIIDNFSLGTLKFSKDYLYCLPKKGGLGLINIREFFISQHTMWFKRAYHSTRDNWRIDMCRLGFGNPFTVACSDLSRKQHPILYDLCASFSLFRDEYYSIGTNYKLAFILNNHMFKRDLKSDKILDVPFFGGKNNPDLFKISNIRYSDCWVGNEFISRPALIAKFSCNITEATFFRMRSALTLFRANARKTTQDDPPVSLGMFFGSFKKGSKYCRNILAKKNITRLCVSSGETVQKNFTLISHPVQDDQVVENALSLWSLPSLPNNFCEFFVVRTAPFGGESRFCAFCSLENSPLVDETFIHLFYNCDSVRQVHERIANTVLGITDNNKSMWFGYPTGELKNNFYCLFY